MTTNEFGNSRSPHSVRFAKDVQNERFSQHVRGPHSPSTSCATPARSSMRIPGHSRTSPVSSTTAFATSTERNVRDPSPTIDRSNELIVMSIQLDELQAKTNQEAHLNDPRVTDRRNNDIAQAQATLRRLQELRHITFEDVETGRAVITSVSSAAYHDLHPPRRDSDRRRNSTSSRMREPSSRAGDDSGSNAYAYVAPPRSRDGFTSRPATGNFDHHVWLAARQDQQRRITISRGLFPVWSTMPVSPYMGDGYIGPGGVILRLNRQHEWRIYNGRRLPYFCN
jgi:hypothetical protein